MIWRILYKCLKDIKYNSIRTCYTELGKWAKVNTEKNGSEYFQYYWNIWKNHKVILVYSRKKYKIQHIFTIQTLSKVWREGNLAWWEACTKFLHQAPYLILKNYMLSISDQEKDLTISTYIQHFSTGLYTCSTKRQRNKRCKSLKGKKKTLIKLFLFVDDSMFYIVSQNNLY